GRARRGCWRRARSDPFSSPRPASNPNIVFGRRGAVSRQAESRKGPAVAKRDVLVLGAGMIGVSAALHLTRRGVSVTLVDRRGAGEETSYGNAGLIEASRMMPMGFPRSFRELIRHGLGFTPHANCRWAARRRLAPFLLRYWAASRADRLDASARVLRPMLAAAPAEHAELAAEAGAARLIRKAGLLKVFRTEAAADET